MAKTGNYHLDHFKVPARIFFLNHLMIYALRNSLFEILNQETEGIFQRLPSGLGHAKGLNKAVNG